MFLKMSITKPAGTYPEETKRLKEVLGIAGAVVISAGAGLSASAGFTYLGAFFEIVREAY